jgi:hypothetical protein
MDSERNARVEASPRHKTNWDLFPLCLQYSPCFKKRNFNPISS